MKTKKKLWGLVIGIDILLAVLVVALCLMLFLGKDKKKDDDPVEDQQETTTPDSQTTAPGNDEDKDPDGSETADPKDENDETEEGGEDDTTSSDDDDSQGSSQGSQGSQSGSSSGNNNNNSSQGGSSQEEEENKPVEEEKITVSAPGSRDNCYTENISYLPFEFATVTLGKGEVVYYNIYGAAGKLLTIEDEGAYVVYNSKTYKAEGGVLRLALTDSNSDPVNLGIGNSLDKRSFGVFFCQIPEPPVTIDSIEQINVSLKAGNMEGNTYLWTAEKDCELNLWIDSVSPETAQYDIIVTVNGYEYALSTFGVDDTESGKRVLSLDIDEGCTVSINVFEKDHKEASLVIKGSADEIVVPDYYDEYVPENGQITTAKIAPGTDVQYNIYGAGDMILTINDPDVYVIYNGVTYGADGNGTVRITLEPVLGMRFPVTLRIGNSSDTRKAFSLDLKFPVGHMANPEALTDLVYLDLSLEEGNEQGYYYSYVPTDDGTVHFSIVMITEGVSADIVYTNNTTYETKSLIMDGVENEYGEIVLSADVTAGDEIVFQVATVPDSEWKYPAADIMIGATFEYPLGSYYNPIHVENPSTVTVEAGKLTYFAGFYSDTVMTVKGENASFSVECSDAVLIPDDNFEVSHFVTAGMRQPVIFGITNSGETDAEFSLKFEYPLGSYTNPEVLEELSYHSVKFSAGNTLGYYYFYTAKEDGTISFWISEVTEGAQAEVMLINNTTYEQLNLTVDGVEDEFGDLVLAMDVSKGDEIMFQVSVLPDEETWEYPAADITVGANFEFPLGSIDNPYSEFVPEDGVLQTPVIPGESFVYYTAYGAGSKIFTLEGDFGYVIYNDVTYGPDASGRVVLKTDKVLGRNPVNFIIGNSGTEEASFTMKFEYPLGDSNNPSVIGLGEHTALLEAASEGYYYTYYAEKSGTLTLTIDTDACANGWQFFMNNITAYRYGERHTHADTTIVSSESFEVTEGDEITILVNTYDRRNEWAAPAGEVVFEITME